MAEREGVTEICSSGKMRWISSAAAVMSTSTRRSKLRERSSSSQISSETSPGARPLTRTCVGVTARASATVGSVTETRFSRSVVLISRDLPTITRKGAAPGVSGDWGAVAGGGVEGAAAPGGAGALWPSICRTPRSKAAASSTSVFMDSDPSRNTRASPSREGAGANRRCMAGSELGLISFAAADHLDRVHGRC